MVARLRWLPLRWLPLRLRLERLWRLWRLRRLRVLLALGTLRRLLDQSGFALLSTQISLAGLTIVEPANCFWVPVNFIAWRAANTRTCAFHQTRTADLKFLRSSG